MRWLIVVVAVGLVAFLVVGQAPPQDNGKKALGRLLGACVDAGGLRREPRPDGKGQRVVVADPAKLAAAVKGAADLPVRPLCDALVGEWSDADAAGRPAYAELLALLGEKSGDERTRGFALFVRWQAEKKALPIKAVEAYAAAAGHFGRGREPFWEGLCYRIAGSICVADLGDPRQALGYYEKSLAIRRRIHPAGDPDVVEALQEVGTAHLRLGDTTHAVEYLNQALALQQKHRPGDARGVAGCLVMLGTAAAKAGDPARAVEYLRRALALYLGDPGSATDPGLALCLNNLGDAYADLGETVRAAASYRGALAWYQKYTPGDNYKFFAAHNNIGYILVEVGELDEALRHFREALRRFRLVYPADHPAVAATHNNIGAVYEWLGDWPAAAEAHRQALAIREKKLPPRHPDVAESLAHLRYVHLRLGEHDRATEFERRALDALRIVADDGEPTAASLRPAWVTLWVTRSRASDLKRALGEDPTAAQLRECEAAYTLAAGVLDHLRRDGQERDASKLHTGESYSQLAPSRVGLLLRLYQSERKPADLRAAFAAAEQGRARVLMESLARRQAARLADAPADLREREEKLLRTVRLADARIARIDANPDGNRAADPEAIWKEREVADAELARVAEQLRTAAPRYADLRYPKPCSVEQARDALAAGEVALHYVLGDDASYLVLLEKDPAKGDPDGGLAVFKLPPRADVERRLSALLDEDTLKNPGRARDAGADLYRVLLAPAADRVRGKPLVVVPDGPLCYLPFQLLVDPDDRYLVETGRVRYAPSLTTLHLTRLWAADRARRGELPDRPLFAVGDPDYGPAARGDDADAVGQLARSEGRTRGEAFARLVNSGREVAELAQLFGPDRCRVLLRGDATGAAVKAASAAGELARYRFLHFACHGVLGRGPGLPPGLVLSRPGAATGGEADDGYLRADEVVNLRLNADLVVLSACRSGRGRLYAGEGVEGLARAFLYAGTRGVVCSLWAVDDARTAELMAGVYRRIRGGEPAADALRQAQAGMAATGLPPFFWAPFVLNGE